VENVAKNGVGALTAIGALTAVGALCQGSGGIKISVISRYVGSAIGTGKRTIRAEMKYVKTRTPVVGSQ
jgi:hypothetical protein